MLISNYSLSREDLIYEVYNFFATSLAGFHGDPKILVVDGSAKQYIILKNHAE